jgi:1,4-alpha-glucan branching enzyme
LSSLCRGFDEGRALIAKERVGLRVASFGKGHYANILPGDEWRVFAAARLAFGALITLCGKVSTYMGCELGMSGGEAFDLAMAEREGNARLQLCCSDLGELYLSNPPLWSADARVIDDRYAGEGVILYETSRNGERLLILQNFSVNAYENKSFNVTKCGRYDEIFNSDNLCYGGSDVINKKAVRAIKCGDKVEMGGVRVAPLAVSVFKLRAK